jgi:energy-coupling factor transport system permease protein
VPVLEEALDRSVALAAAMDARGFGRRTPSSVRRRRATAACTLAGLLAVCVGLYGLLDASSPRALGVPFLIAGCLLATAGLVLGGRQAGRSRYRPDPWRVAETLTALAGAGALALTLAAGHLEAATLNPGITVPYTVPGLPWLAVAGVLVALLPAWVSPPLPRPVAGPVASPVLERAA